MIACGSSMYAAQAAQYYFKTLKTFTKINIYDPVELFSNDIAPHETVVLISQSGETKDLIDVI
jgi:glucosamine 6-phosphate synthetase-like amidotransferase/phosphosugar isomerase protein